MAQDESIPVLDIERQSILGRACPRCGGKIIPSNTAVYQSSSDPNAVFLSWQCEKCGFEEVFEKPATAQPKHGKPAAQKQEVSAERAPEPPASTAADGQKNNQSGAKTSKAQLNHLPPDVRKLLELMKNPPKREY
jgi:predicted nucleic-acid-binding Zn-ribbon protein